MKLTKKQQLEIDFLRDYLKKYGRNLKNVPIDEKQIEMYFDFTQKGKEFFKKKYNGLVIGVEFKELPLLWAQQRFNIDIQNWQEGLIEGILTLNELREDAFNEYELECINRLDFTINKNFSDNNCLYFSKKKYDRNIGSIKEEGNKQKVTAVNFQNLTPENKDIYIDKSVDFFTNHFFSNSFSKPEKKVGWFTKIINKIKNILKYIFWG